MPEQPYTNRELDHRFRDIGEKLDLILTQTTKHNGRLSKVEKALLLAFGLIVGLGLKEASAIISMLV